MSDHIARAVLSRMNLREVALAPHYDALVSDLRQLATTDPDDAQKQFLARREELCAAYGLEEVPQGKPFAFSNGVAVIPITGTLINRFGRSYGFVTGYNFIRSQLNQAVLDNDVKLIVFDVNSYGGEAAGCFELSADIRNARAAKPSIAVIDSNSYSAGYALASAAGKVVCTPSGGAGSIGVVAMHFDMSKALDKFGITVTMIHAGKHKVDGNPYEALSKDVKASIQAGVDKSRDAFVSLVAENRKLDAADVRATEAQIYRAEEALSLGLIDAIATPSEAVRAYLTELSGSTTQPKEEPTMATTGTTQGSPTATTSVATEPQAATPAVDSATVASEARTSERARIQGIQGCEEAKGRDKLASHLAFNTNMSVDEAKAILAASPSEQAAAAPAANPFESAMDSAQHPNVGAGAVGGDDPAQNPAMAILSAQQLMTGQKLID